MPPRFARDYSARARLAVFVETHPLRTYERDQGVFRKPSLHAIRESRIASSPRDKLIRPLQLIQVFGLPTAPPWALVRNWSSLFLNRMLNVVSDP